MERFDGHGNIVSLGVDLSGKTICFLGDSYSVNLDATAWCDILCNNVGATLKKWTWSGHKFTASASASNDDGHSIYRQALHISAVGWNPDIIVIAGGTNDQGANETIGSLNTTAKSLTGFNLDDYVESVQATLFALKANHPDSLILCGWTPANGLHNESDDYVEAMKNVCIYYGVQYVEFRDCGISFNVPDEKEKYWFGSGHRYANHLNQEGHNAVAKAIETKIKNVLG